VILLDRVMPNRREARKSPPPLLDCLSSIELWKGDRIG
jgi:hypothetical protein